MLTAKSPLPWVWPPLIGVKWVYLHGCQWLWVTEGFDSRSPLQLNAACWGFISLWFRMKNITIKRHGFACKFMISGQRFHWHVFITTGRSRFLLQYHVWTHCNVTTLLYVVRYTRVKLQMDMCVFSQVAGNKTTRWSETRPHFSDSLQSCRFNYDKCSQAESTWQAANEMSPERKLSPPQSLLCSKWIKLGSVITSVSVALTQA